MQPAVIERSPLVGDDYREFREMEKRKKVPYSFFKFLADKYDFEEGDFAGDQPPPNPPAKPKIR